MNNITLTAEIRQIEEEFINAFEEVKHLETLEFRSLSLSPRNKLFDEVFDPKQQKNFLLQHLPDFAEEIMNINGPVVYFFSIKEGIPNLELEDMLSHLYTFKFGEAKGMATLPKILKKVKVNDERVLYVGSKRKDFYLRVCQHLGYCQPGTQGLNYYKWPKHTQKELTFSYCSLKDFSPLAISFIERSLHLQLKPLIGDSPYYG